MEEEKVKGEGKLSDYDKKMQELQMRKAEAELQDLEERLAERELKRETKRQRSLTNGKTLSQIKSNDKSAQDRCNHKKGGNGADGIIGGQGDDSQYAVLKHRVPNGDVWVRCLRCAKTWKPPLEEQFHFNAKGEVDPKGKFDEAKFKEALREYEQAVAFQTRNQMSGSIQFRWSDGGKYFREVTKDTTLR